MVNGRQPAARVSLVNSLTVDVDGIGPVQNSNEQVLGGLISAEAVNNNFYMADTFRAEFTVAELLASAPQLQLSDLLGQTRITLRVAMGSSATALKSYIIGNVDDVRFDPAANMVELTGRDFTAYFIDTKTTQKWPNITASAAATLLAQKYSLSPVVTTTDVKIGTYLNSYQAKMGDARTEWDFLTWLAQQCLDDNGQPFVVFVFGNSLYFGPKPQLTAYNVVCQQKTDSAPFAILPAATNGPPFGGIAISFSRNKTTLSNIVVTLTSKQFGKPRPLKATYPVSFKGIKPGAATNKVQLYERTVRPNMTQEQLLVAAQALQHQIGQHEMRMSMSLPGDELLDLLSSVNVSGTDSPLDQSYFIDTITRRVDVTSGYTMDVSAKNHDTASEAEA